MKDIKDYTLKEIKELQNSAASDFKFLLRDFFRDHPFIEFVTIHKESSVIHFDDSYSIYINKDDCKNEIKTFISQDNYA